MRYLRLNINSKNKALKFAEENNEKNLLSLGKDI